jgi:hypothetical protein
MYMGLQTEQEHQPKLSWEAVLNQFERLIAKAARQVNARGTNGGMGEEDLKQEGQIRLYECWMKWCVDPKQDKDMDEFGPIFRTALWRLVRQRAGRPTFNIDIDDAAYTLEDKSVRTDSIIDEMQQSENMALIMSQLSESARLVVRELIQPSDRTLFEVWADIKRKEQLKSQGKKVNIPKDNTVRMKHIARALSLSSKQYDNIMLEIKRVVGSIYNR